MTALRDIVGSIETLKGEIARQNKFIDKTLDAESAAYNKLFVAITNCYRELQTSPRASMTRSGSKQRSVLCAKPRGFPPT